MEEKLSREEILSRSRQENRKGDERERTIRMEGESFSLLFALLLGLVLLFWKRAHGLPDEDVQSMFWMSFVANRLYRLTRRRNSFEVVTLLISLAFLAWNLIQFFQMT